MLYIFSIPLLPDAQYGPQKYITGSLWCCVYYPVNNCVFYPFFYSRFFFHFSQLLLFFSFLFFSSIFYRHFVPLFFFYIYILYIIFPQFLYFTLYFFARSHVIVRMYNELNPAGSKGTKKKFSPNTQLCRRLGRLVVVVTPRAIPV